MLLTICAGLSVGAAESGDSDSAAIALAIPRITSIVKTPYGYRLNTSSGTRFANRTSYGYRISTDRGTVFLNRASYGFRVSSDR